MRTLVLGLAIYAQAAAAFPLCPYPAPKACSRFFQSDAVFVGTVVSEQRSDDYLRYRLSVSTVLRGAVGRTAIVWTGNDSGRVLWQLGRDYIVFAERHDGRLETTDDCGPLSDPTQLAETVKEILALRGEKVASVEGEVLVKQPVGPGVAGVRVQPRGSGGTYETVSDQHGLFRLALPSGRYHVLVDPKQARQTDYNLGVDPRDVLLVPGQCAQFQFVAQ